MKSLFEVSKLKRAIIQRRRLFVFLPFIMGIVSCNNDDDTFHSSTLSNDITNQDYVNILERNLTNLPNNAQVAIALVHDENTEYLGVTNDNMVLKVTNNKTNIFEIGSITKVFTSICLSELIASEEASLTETLQNQFDFQFLAGGNITLRQLANHTSGLPVVATNVNEIQGFNAEDPYAVYSYENLKSYLQNHIMLNSVSGTNYEYSNLGTGILAYILAQKRHSTVEEMMQSIVFDPLGMNSTTTLLDNVDVSRLVEPRDINGNIVSHWNFAETASGAGSIKSSVIDMVKFIQKNFGDDDVYNLPKEVTFDKGNNQYMGLGWSIYKDNNYTLYLHDGGTGGFSSMLMLDKEKKIGAIVLSNVGDYHSTIVPLCNDFILEMSN